MSSLAAIAWLVKPFATRSKISTCRGVSREKLSASASCDLLGDLLLESARQAAIDRRHQLPVVDRLLDEVLGAGLDAGDRHRHVGMAGDQHHRQRDLAAGQFAHQLDSVHAGHAHVGDHAAGASGRDGLQEPVGGFEYFDREAEHPQHLAERVADRVLIVDDKDGGHDRDCLFEREPEAEFGCTGCARL